MMRRSMKKTYLVVLRLGMSIPEDCWDAVVDKIRLYVHAQDTKEARETAIECMELHHLYCKVTYIREIKERTK